MAAYRRRVACLLLSVLLFVYVAFTEIEASIENNKASDNRLERSRRAAVGDGKFKLSKQSYDKHEGAGPGQSLREGEPHEERINNDNNPHPFLHNAPGHPMAGGDQGSLHKRVNPDDDSRVGGDFPRKVGGMGNRFGNQDNHNPHQELNYKVHHPIDEDHVADVPEKSHKPSKIKLSTSPECADDVRQYCSHGIKDNNFAILDCLQSDERTNNDVSEKCQHFLWMYKQSLTKDDRFDSASLQMCSTELKKIKECSQQTQGQGLVIPCLIENFENITTASCQKFLNKMASIIFSDYRYIYHFAEKCSDDIRTFECGRLHPTEEDAPHSQGRTVACLAEHLMKLKPECKHQVLRVYELQSDDYHLDRPLYYACHDDRENLCAEVKSGNGAVFQCLFEQLGSPHLTQECREKLELRQRLMAEDVRVEHTFYARCREDIEHYGCLGGSTGHEDTKRANVLLCLESAHMEEKKVDALCVQEMLKVRQRLLEDYQINPDLMAMCGDEIEHHCQGLQPGGNTLHCLMKLARDRKLRSNIRDQCKAQLGRLLQEVNIGEDYRLDKPLQIACADVVTAVCSHVKPGDGAVINCLMDNMDEDEMTDECEERLLEIQFFMTRDFRMDPDLYKSCKRDAKKHCHETGPWADPYSTSPDQGPRVLACLHRHFRHHANDNEVEPLSRGCIFAVQRVMQQRAHSVDLNPAIEDACMLELGDVCSDDKEATQKGAEIECLQDNYDTLSPKCKEAIANFTEEESEDIHMDTILMKACTPMIKKFCEEELDNDAEADDILECLIEHKNHADMIPKCAVGIEHHQLMSLKDFRFNHKFKEACQKSVQNLCKKKTTKYEVVTCLSEHVRNDTLLEKKQRVDHACRKQLKVELLERSESINLDPELHDKCKDDLHRFCENVSPGNAAAIECLKKNKEELSDRCRNKLFDREKEEFAIADYGLLHTCKRMIRKHCEDSSTEPEILECLKKAKDLDSFDENCRRIVIQRQITQSKDYRLNPMLQKACQQDIPKFCSNVLVKAGNDSRLEGKVINCLKKQFAIKRLSSSCEHQIRDRVKAAAMDIRMAPVLLQKCRAEIKHHCKDELLTEKEDSMVESMHVAEAGQAKVIECLKTKFNQRKIQDPDCRQEIASMLAESHIDVNVDPLLHTACQSDLLHLCRQVTPGQGRQMSCLLSFLDEDPRALSGHCRDLLRKRKEMWEYAAQVAPPETFSEIYDSIASSPSRNYFVVVLFTLIAIIFIVGISCGRVSKRVRAEVKNK